ncbi:hypothetical protein BI050_gp35 [Pectobacterium phage PP90]|uniref:Uncharacterized protein n=1 Tax=Pectobacterium phage PP90 TaxID=1873959 RepID=A0A1B1PEI8_9CAUD|nr:hypothetical protein BI050_gp35 [Pectobacterium phage PP90]ANT45392.1 hypothetical protein BI050_gp35 [Pectobacterium phage PP90]
MKEYLQVDKTSKTGLRWTKSPGGGVLVGAEAFTTIKGDG